MIVLALAGVFAAASPLSAQVGLGLSPMRLELRLGAGAQHSGPLTLTNDSSVKMRVRAEILDFYIDPNETPQFERRVPQEASFSCRDWLTVNPMEVEMEPGASVLVRYTLKAPPQSAERGYHCGAGFTTLPPAEQVNGTGLKTAVRAVSAFYAVIGNPGVEGEMKGIKIEPIAKTKTSTKDDPEWNAVVTIENYGFMHFRPVGELSVLDADGNVVETRKFNSLPVLPKRQQRFLFPLKSPLQGAHYTLRARVDLGAHEIQEATVLIDDKPNDRTEDKP